MIFFIVSLINVANTIKNNFIFDPVQKRETNQFIKPFLDKKKCLFLSNMEPLRAVQRSTSESNQTFVVLQTAQVSSPITHFFLHAK